MRKLETPPLLLASSNPGKRALIAHHLKELGVDYVTPETHPILDVEETGTTYFENARLKAEAACHATGLVSLADDSGIEIPALGGIPGVRTGRFAQELGGFETAFKKLEEMLRGKDTTAIFTSIIVIAWPDGHHEVGEGVLHGRLLFPARPGKGFGFYPIFAAEGDTRTFSQLEDHEIQLHSHRARAFEKLKSVFTP